MTTTTPSSARTRSGADLLDVEARRVRVRADLAEMAGLRELLEGLGFWADLEAELDRCVPPMFVAPFPTRAQRRRLGLHFDAEEVGRFLSFAGKKCRHVKGRHAGRPLVPDLWQVIYVLAPVFGLRQSDGLRYYRELFLEVPRKNGKSTLSAAVGLYLLMADSNLKAGRFYEPGAEVYAAATTTEQARHVFTPAEQIAAGSPSLAKRLGIQTGKRLVYERTLSSWAVISGDPAKAEQKMGGNAHGNIIDETHVHRDARLIETMETSTAGREQPLTVHLTTAGADVEGTIYAEKHDLAVAIAEGKATGLRTWAVIYTIPDELRDRWDDPEVWQACNPGLGVSVSIEYLEDAAAKARRSERKRLAFCRLHLNVRTSTVSRWVDLDLYDRGAAHLPADWEAVRASTAFCGLDLSSSLDLSALAAVVPRWVPDPSDPEYEMEILEVLVKAWTPAERLGNRPPAERELFARWIREGWLTTCPGETIDYDAIEAEAIAWADWLDIDALGFDRWGSKQIVGHLADGGLKVAEIGQGFAGISPAMKETEKVIAEGRLWTGGNPLLRYAFASLAVEQDASGNIKPNRAKSSGRIDPAVAVVMAIDGYARSTSGPSVYEERGMASA